jgi:hypothetical protein
MGATLSNDGIHINGHTHETDDPGFQGDADSVGGQAGSEAPPGRGTAYGRLVVYGMDDLDNAPQRSYLLKGLLSPAEISLWVGPPKCGKSFLLLYITYMLSLGRSVFGRRVKPTKVLYVAAEGEGGINKRIDALRKRYGASPDFHFIAQPADLLHEGGHLEDLVAAAKDVEAQLIVIDTVSRALAGGDENGPKDMGQFIANITEVRHRTKAHIAGVHHGTKASNGTKTRGHGSLEGADDVLIEVVKAEDGSRCATVVHAKDDADGMRWGFSLESVALGMDEDGDPITTLIVQENAEPPPTTQSKPDKLPNGEQIALTCLLRTMQTAAVPIQNGDDECLAVPEATWREQYYGEVGGAQDTKKKAFNRAKVGLLVKDRIICRGVFVFPQTLH